MFCVTINYRTYVLGGVFINQLERNIIIGSLLGDGSLTLYGRSINAYYREHGCDAQMEYRKWKADKLKRLDFKFSDKGKYGRVYSPSREMFTKLYNMFYVDRIKVLTPDNIKLLDHPVGLACLYMDDGTLVMDTAKKPDRICVFPRITIYTLNFTKEENILLINHIKKIFEVNFILKRHPDGHNYCLQLNKAFEILTFIKIVTPFVNEIECMKYKIDVKSRLDLKSEELEVLYPNKNIYRSKLSAVDNSYSAEDEIKIIDMKNRRFKDKEISVELDRSYWSIVDKIRRLRKENRL